MNIKTKLILAATAVSLLSTPAFAFRTMGDAGGDSAYAIPPNERGHSGIHYNYGGTDAYSAYALGHITRRPTHRQHRVHPSHPRR
jgi:hypothetical protein